MGLCEVEGCEFVREMRGGRGEGISMLEGEMLCVGNL